MNREQLCFGVFIHTESLRLLCSGMKDRHIAEQHLPSLLGEFKCMEMDKGKEMNSGHSPQRLLACLSA